MSCCCCCCAAGVSLQANTQALMSLAGFESSDVLLTAWNNDTFRPCHYVAVDKKRQCLVSWQLIYDYKLYSGSEA